MKIDRFIIFFLVVYLSNLCFSQTDSVYVSYETEEYSIVIPGNWYLDDSTNTEYEFVVYAPQIKDTDEYLSYISLKKQVIDKNIKIESVEGLSNLSFNMLKTFDKTIKLIYSKKISPDTQEISYTQTILDENNKKILQKNLMQIVKINDNLYFTCYSSLIKDYKYYLEEAKFVQSTLKPIE